jgi:hypothetical protein
VRYVARYEVLADLPYLATAAEPRSEDCTEVGVAVAVTDSPATAAGCEVSARQCAPSSHSHVGRPTYVVCEGSPFDSMVIVGTCNIEAAR